MGHLADTAVFQLLRVMPLGLISRLVGRIVHSRRPRLLAETLKRILISAYGIDPSEAELPLSSYPSFGDFFCRRLRNGARDIGEAFLVSPCDGTLSHSGILGRDGLIQCKGRNYSLEALVREAGYAGLFSDGAYLTIYLSPRNYHRVHCPAAGELESSCYIPGRLWPVNSIGLQNAPELFCRNERWIGCLETELGHLAIIMVGSLNVGKIQLERIPGSTNSPGSAPAAGFVRHEAGLRFSKGEAYGLFRMGSTVILLFCKRMRKNLEWERLPVGELRMGMDLLGRSRSPGADMPAGNKVE